MSDLLDRHFDDWNKKASPGFVVGVTKGGEVLYRRGFGMASVEMRVHNGPKTRMRIASTTKHFTALLALLLAEEGKLDLEAPIRTYVPELVGPGGDPTLRLLLLHRGGSRCFNDLGTIAHGRALEPRGTGLEVQARQRGRNFEPGKAMIYNNGGYHLLSIAISRAGGAPFERQLKRRLFDVLGMEDTESIPSDYEITPGFAAMHEVQADGKYRRSLDSSEEILGDGGIVSTVDDMLRWTLHLRTRDKFGSKKTWAQLTTPPDFPDGSPSAYAFGLIVQHYRGLRTIQHAGAMNGATSQMLTFPDHDVDIVVLTNMSPGAEAWTIAEQVADVVLADQLRDRSQPISTEEFKEQIGDWWSPQTSMTYSLLDDNGGLRLGVAGYPFGFALERTEDGRIISRANGLGPVTISLTELTGSDLTIAFGGEAATYQKLSESMVDKNEFATRISGRYYSEDADCKLVIESSDDGLTAAFSDGIGHNAATIDPIGERVAFLRPATPASDLYAALTVDDSPGPSLRLDTIRTRNLRFSPY